MNTNKQTMKALVTKGQGGFEQLSWQEEPIPHPGQGEVLIKVLAAAVNNTDINTRLGWYSSKVKEGTDDLGKASSREVLDDGGWGAPTPFPLIQGTDCCGLLVDSENPDRPLSEKPVLVRPCMLSRSSGNFTPWFGSDFSGSFAQYVLAPEDEVFAVESDWTPEQLASLPCAWGTAENLIRHGQISSGDRVLVTGASGGVGSAALQLLKIRGAEILAQCGSAKAEKVAALGVQVVPRERSLSEIVEKESLDCVIDLVGGKGFPDLLGLLKRRGRYVTSGAIGGPMVSLDLRVLYLKDLQLTGCTRWDKEVFPSLIDYVEKGKVSPMIHRSYPMKDTAEAQKEFMEKKHFGKILLIPADE